MEVEIDIRKNLQKNIEKYFSDSKKSKRKIESAERALAKNVEKRKKEEMSFSEKKEEIIVKKRKPRSKWFMKFHWAYTTEGFLVIAGRNATQNEMIFSKHVAPGDKVMHADVVGAPLTVIKSEGKAITPLAIREASEIAAAYSSAWKGGVAAVDVYWINPDQVSQTAPSGEHLAKGSFMIRGQKNYTKKVDLKVSIGVAIIKNEEGAREARAVAGNTQAMSKHSAYFVTVTPGVMEQNDAAKEVKKRLMAKAMPDDKILIEAIPLDDFVKLVPAGKSFVTG